MFDAARFPPRSDQQAEPVVEVVAYLGDGFDAHQEERVRDMPGGCAVNSGQPGHSHVYAILSRHGREVLDLPNHQHLCRVVGDWFHATDPKISYQGPAFKLGFFFFFP